MNMLLPCVVSDVLKNSRVVVLPSWKLSLSLNRTASFALFADSDVVTPLNCVTFLFD